jgi:hypothetical protein
MFPPSNAARAIVLSYVVFVSIDGLAKTPAKPPAEIAPPRFTDNVSGPVAGTVMTPGYARTVATMAYAWGWPLVNLHNRRVAFGAVPAQGYVGAMGVAPPNKLMMITDYVSSDQRDVAHPNQDVVYGFGLLSLEKTPVVLQVPDFGERFWTYELADQRTDSFAKVGKIYDTRPGFYLIVGPDWHGKTPRGITGVLRSPTNLGVVIPRVFMNDAAEDRATIQPVLEQVQMYPLADFDGSRKAIDWKSLPHFPDPNAGASGEKSWVKPVSFFDELKEVMDEVPPLPGEEALYAQFRALLTAAERDKAVRTTIDEAAAQTERDVVTPLFRLENVGVEVKHHWTRPFNNAAFGTDYLTRLAIAKSNIFTNAVNETVYLYQYKDMNGERLNGARAYTLTFGKDELPPVSGFWSLTMYNAQHFFEPNALKRYSLGTKNKTLTKSPDGSLTIYVQPNSPGPDKESNWLPSPKGDFAMTIRAYGPDERLIKGAWEPPPVAPVK